jgi:hypothetical protein
MEVHRFLNLFPVMSDDDFDDLVESIRTLGQINPIWINKDGVLLNGRMVLKACEILGIELRIETWHGDPAHEEAFILACNVHRLHMTKGQLAMFVALACPEPSPRGGRADRGKSEGKVKGLKIETERVLVCQARCVIREFGKDSGEVHLVCRGIASLQEMYDKALERKDRREHWDKRAEEIDALYEEVGPDIGTDMTDADLRALTENDPNLRAEIGMVLDAQADVATRFMGAMRVLETLASERCSRAPCSGSTSA